MRASYNRLLPFIPSALPKIMQPMATPSLRRRMACWLYEGILMFAVYFISAYLFLALSQSHNETDNRHLLMAFLFIVFGIYFAWFWAKGQTLAMKTWDVRLVDRFNAPVTQKRALLRYCLSWLWFLPPLAIASPFALPMGEIIVLVFGWVAVWALLSRFHPDRQFWHDALAGTRLVSSPPMSR
jgi:uncharacterized RDD family membrane protein YckC